MVQLQIVANKKEQLWNLLQNLTNGLYNTVPSEFSKNSVVCSTKHAILSIEGPTFHTHERISILDAKCVKGNGSQVDIFDGNLPLYHVDRVVRETGKKVDNGFEEQVS
jgi:hypothetical protein